MREQPVRLVHPIGRGREDAVDRVSHLGARRRRDQVAKLLLAQVRVRHDAHAPTARLGGRDQIGDGAEAEAVPRLRRQFLRNRRRDLAAGAKASMDFLHRDLDAVAEKPRRLPRRPFRAPPRLHRSARKVEVSENVRRDRGIAPDQRVETVERQPPDRVRYLIQQVGQIGRTNGNAHKQAPDVWRPYRATMVEKPLTKSAATHGDE